MGAFFSNLHILLPNEDAESAIGELASRTRAYLAAAGYREADEGTEGDRSVVIAATSNPSWFAVYDEDCDAPDEAELKKLGRALSAGATCLAAVVSDSDELTLSLFAEGKQQDRVRHSAGRHTKLKEAAWRRLLGPRFSAFLSSFSGDSGFAEAPLDLLGDILSIDAASFHLGYRYRDDLTSSRRLTLHFVTPKGAEIFVARSGPPLIQGPGSVSTKLVVGEPIEGFGFGSWAMNQGGESTGVVVALAFPAAVSRHVDVQSVRLSIGESQPPLSSPVEPVSINEGTVLRAHFPSARLAPFVEAARELSGAEWMKLNKVFQRAHMWVTLQGHALSPGEFTTELFIVPSSNPGGVAVVKIQATVLSERW